MKVSLTSLTTPSMRLAAWSETARVSVLMMELLWLANWYDMLVQPAVSGMAMVVGLGGIMVGTHIVARVMNTRNVKLLWRRVIFIGWVLLVLLLSLHWMVYGGGNLSLLDLILRPVRSIGMLQEDLREFWHILMILVLVWRGVALAREPVGILAAQFSFQLGLVMMLFFGIGMGFIKPLQAVLTLYVFLFFGLLGMSAARITSIGDLRGAKLPLPGSKWVVGIVLSAVVIVGSAVFLGWAASSWASEIILQGYMFLFSVAIVIGLIVLSPIIALIFWFSPAVRELLSEIFKGTFISGFLEFIKTFADGNQSPPEWLVTGMQIGKPVLLGGVILLVMVGLLFLLSWKPWQMRALREEGSSDLPFRPVFTLPKWIMNRLGGRFANSRRLIAAARVRWVYTQLMALCAGLGQPRPQAATPVEFLPRILRLFPAQTGELELITAAYLKVRYGMVPETQGEVDEIEAAWARVKRAGDPLVKEYKRRMKKRAEG